jgi:hypothetical protein
VGPLIRGRHSRLGTLSPLIQDWTSRLLRPAGAMILSVFHASSPSSRFGRLPPPSSGLVASTCPVGMEKNNEGVKVAGESWIVLSSFEACHRPSSFESLHPPSPLLMAPHYYAPPSHSVCHHSRLLTRDGFCGSGCDF